MQFSIIAEMFEKMENTSKRIELTNILVELLKKTPKKIIPNVATDITMTPYSEISELHPGSIIIDEVFCLSLIQI